MTHLRQTAKRLFLGTLLASACSAACAVATPEQVQAACKPDSAPDASLGGIQVRAVAAKAKDLPYYEVRSTTTGSSVRIYHEADLADAASSKAACLMGMLDMLRAGLPHVSGAVNWSPMVLTHDENYIPPKRDGEIRWVNVFKSTTWDAAPMRFLIATMPHEETHLSQHVEGAKFPRWFEEGHAEWAGLQVTEQIAPDLALNERTRLAEDFRKLGAARLGVWGGIRVKPEAIERQLSAEDRERRKKDPGYVPPGPFSFGPGDFAEDNGDEGGRYGAALALFTGLEQRHGRAAVQHWVRAVLDGKDGKQIVPLARQMLGEDLTPLLQ